MKMYGSYSDADLDHWQNLPMNSYVLTQSAFGAWLMRRDENKAKQFPTVSLSKVKEAREEIEQYGAEEQECGDQKIANAILDVLEILDKLMESEEAE